MTISFRPLAEVKMMLEEIGHDVSYAYDDIVFVEHTAFLFQFDDKKPRNLKLFLNTEIDTKEPVRIEKEIKAVSKIRRFTIINSGSFSMKQNENSEEIELLFFPKNK